MKPDLDTVEYRENPVFMELVSVLGNGFILSLFNIDFLFLEYLFPIVGCGIMLYGCHLVKDYSRNFLVVYYLAFVRLLLMLFNFLLDWTSVSNHIYVAYIQIATSAIAIVLLFIFLDKAFAELYLDAGIDTYRHVFFKYIFMYLCTVASTYLALSIGILGALISIVILMLNVLYIGLIFHRTGKTLTTCNVEIEFSSYSKETVHRYAYCIVGYILILVFTIYYCNKETILPFETHGSRTGNNMEYEETKKKLKLMGMKQAIIDDLSASEYEYLSTATALTSQVDTRPANGGIIKFTTYRITLYGSERILIYYSWVNEPSNRLFQILEYNVSSISNICEISSRCLYNDDDTHQTMEVPIVETSINTHGNAYTDQKLPNSGSNLRGYLAFSYTPMVSSPGKPHTTQIDFYYQVSIFNLPYLKITDYMDQYDKYETNIAYNRLTVPLKRLYTKNNTP